MPDPADLAEVVAGLGEALRDLGLPVGPDRCERFARAVTVVRPATPARLLACAQATLASTPDHADLLAHLFTWSAELVAEQAAAPLEAGRGAQAPQGTATGSSPIAAAGSAWPAVEPPPNGRPARSAPVRALASGDERLAHRDFAELTPQELLALAALMRNLTVATPPRHSHRQRPDPYGRRVDLRATLRQARRTGGHPVRLRRRSRRDKPRRLVVLCDISGSMEPYARAMLQLLYCAAGTRAEVFTFATRLTRLTRELSRVRPSVALERAGRLAPDWSGGTRIGAALREFNTLYGRRGVARGAVVLIVSDGWDTGDPAVLDAELARLSLVAHRLVWANPRTQSPRYRPLVGGMAAALPYCDAIVSAHNLAALPDLVAALSGREP